MSKQSNNKAKYIFLFSIIVVAAFVFAIQSTGSTHFIDAAKVAGVEYPYYTDIDGPAGEYITFYLPSGSTWGDYDQDGCVDLYVADPIGPNILYKNDCNGKFVDVAEELGVDYSGRTTGVAFGDIDNDGCLDLYLANFNETNILYKNNCDKTFTDTTEVSGVAGDGRGSMSVSWADYDNDGYLDIYVANLAPAMTTIVSEEGIFMDLIAYSQHNYLFRNNKDGTFVDVAKEAGAEGTSAEIHFNKPEFADSGLSYAATWFDYNRDGCIDLMVASDASVSPFFKNNCDGTFTDIAKDVGLDSYAFGMGVAIADINDDTYTDIFLTNFFTDLLWVSENGKFVEIATQAGIVDESGGIENENMGGWSADKNPEVGWGAVFIDYDNDGDKDLFVANGGVFDSFTPEGEDTSFSYNRFYINNNGAFEEATEQGGLVNVLRGYGVVTADYDNDGKLDMYVTNVDGPNSLYRNNVQNNNSWIKIRLVGVESNRLGVGAEVELTSDDLRIVSQMTSGTSYLSQDDYILHFGLGERDKIDRIVVIWPSGIIQELENIDVNQELIIEESE